MDELGAGNSLFLYWYSIKSTLDASLCVIMDGRVNGVSCL